MAITEDEDLTMEDRQVLMNIIYIHHQKPFRPTALVDVQATPFFDWWDNRFRGWFATACYATGRREKWFIVDVSSETCERDDFFLQEISVQYGRTDEWLHHRSRLSRPS